MRRRPVRPLRVATSLLALAASVAFSSTARSQEIVRQWFGDGKGQTLGLPVALVGDVNADGFIDVGVGALQDDTLFFDGGMLRILSGRDGAVLYSFYGDATGAELGILGQSPIGDVDLDGYDDILASEWYYGSAAGRIFVFSGKDGSVLRTITGTPTRMVGGSISGTGDIDGDGVPDFAASATAGSYVTLFSGATSTVIRKLTASDPASKYFGNGLLNPGDIDGDGVNDLIVIENGCFYAKDKHFYAFSGSTGAVIWETNEQWNCNYGSFAHNPVVIGDVTGDGIADWAMGSLLYQTGHVTGSVTFYSGSDGSAIRTVYNPIGSGPSSTLGREAIAAVSDVNGDGVPDFATADTARSEDPGGDIFFFSGIDGAYLFHAGGGASAAQFGIGLTGGADSDGDGRLDVYVGDWADGTNGAFAGAVTQLRVEPIVVDVFPRDNPYLLTQLLVNGGIPGNPFALFLADVNGTPFFDLIEVATFDASRRFYTVLSVPPGLTGITARILAFSLDAGGRLLKSNYETITFP